MNALSGISVVLPSLDPDEKLLNTINALLDHGFQDIILIDDGSKAENKHYFQTAARHPQVQLLRHVRNRGKGAALKTAFRWFLRNRPHALGVVTVDGDGQHAPEDTVACALEMKNSGKVILGCRDFSMDHVPPRSRMGNRITCGVFRFLCGMKISDTQTGLRAIPTPAVKEFCQVKGDRFEYETNMLLEMKARGIAYGEVKIATVYIEENKSSHFRAVRDSARIYKLIFAHFFRYTLSSILSALVDTGMYALMLSLLVQSPKWLIDTLPFLVARGVSSLFNFAVNKNIVFHSQVGTKKALIKYYLLAVPVLLLQWGLTNGVFALFHIGSQQRVLKTLIYVVVMGCLYVGTFLVQQRWVFAKSSETKD